MFGVAINYKKKYDTFTTISDEHFITLSVNLAVNMTVICLLFLVFFNLVAVSLFFCFRWREKKRGSLNECGVRYLSVQ